MAGSVGSKKRAADINVVPLIDIVLVLLIIFMVITPLIVKEMDLRLPEKTEDEPPPPPDAKPIEQVVMIMNADLTITVNKEVVARELLLDRLTVIMNARPSDQKILFFDAYDDTNYGETVKVLDIARSAGVQKIGIITDRTNLAPVPGATPAEGVPGVPGMH